MLLCNWFNELEIKRLSCTFLVHFSVQSNMHERHEECRLIILRILHVIHRMLTLVSQVGRAEEKKQKNPINVSQF